MKKYQALEIEITDYLSIDVLNGYGASDETTPPWETPDQPLI